MKKEYRALIFSMINNFIIAIIKIIGGSIFGLGALFADGLHTFSDGIINIVALVGAKLSRKKPTKHHPYGFGRIEYLTNLFVGIMLFILGAFIFLHSFNKELVIPQINILWLLLVVCIMKLVAIGILFKNAKKTKSKILLTTAKESLADIYSTVGVAIITLILQLAYENPILIYMDIIGTIIISLIIMKSAFKIIYENSLSLVGEIDSDPELVEKVRIFLNEHHKQIQDEDIYLIKYGSYYKLQLNIQLDEDMTLKKISRLEDKIKKELIKHRSFRIKHISIFATNHLETMKGE